MRTPIYDFANKYAGSDAVRAHMPGHKGVSRLGIEAFDITEIAGADSLFEADGIIRESEENASRLFGAHTLYSTEGSSLSIRAISAMIVRFSASLGRAPLVLAARNAHKSFIYGAALSGLAVEWIYGDSYLSFELDSEELAALLTEHRPTAVYITSPDYLGRVADIERIAEICHAHGALLVVDNAHGAYLKFLSPSRHPIDLGADIVCDSAHKTLPVLTGGGYLHISESAPRALTDMARSSMEIFGSTSPSYLILESLDLCNRELASGYAERIAAFAATMAEFKAKLEAGGYRLLENEPFKVTLDAKKYGYLGTELAKVLEESGVYPEFADPDYLVMMMTPDTEKTALDKIADVLLGVKRRAGITDTPPAPSRPVRAISPREALLFPAERVDTRDSVGRVLATASVGCPPAIPIAVSGEIIDEATCRAFEYYGVGSVSVVK